MGAVAFSLLVTLFGLALSSRLHRQWGPLALGGVSATLLLVAISRLDLAATTIGATALLAAATWNFLLNRRLGAAPTRRRN